MKNLKKLLKYFLWALFIGLLVWWATLEPSNIRNWQTDVSKLAYATVSNNIVTVHNIRNFDYRSETDYTPRYYDKTFDLNKLDSVDLIASYWMGPNIAHTFLSFGFNDKDYLAISIETRKEKNEDYSTFKGFFRQYELYYVVADERDVIRLRTNYRKNPPEDVYLYRVLGTKEDAKRMFMEYIHKINQLNSQPEFYNSLTTNCTTNIWFNSRVNPHHLPFSWKILSSGHVPEYLYEKNRLKAHGKTFPDLKKQAYINNRAKASESESSVHFSSRIREGII